MRFCPRQKRVRARKPCEFFIALMCGRATERCGATISGSEAKRNGLWMDAGTPLPSHSLSLAKSISRYVAINVINIYDDLCGVRKGLAAAHNRHRAPQVPIANVRKASVHNSCSIEHTNVRNGAQCCVTLLCVRVCYRRWPFRWFTLFLRQNNNIRHKGLCTVIMISISFFSLAVNWVCHWVWVQGCRAGRIQSMQCVSCVLGLWYNREVFWQENTRIGRVVSLSVIQRGYILFPCFLSIYASFCVLIMRGVWKCQKVNGKKWLCVCDIQSMRPCGYGHIDIYEHTWFTLV